MVAARISVAARRGLRRDAAFAVISIAAVHARSMSTTIGGERRTYQFTSIAGA
jgi:hypothetical protein